MLYVLGLRYLLLQGCTNSTMYAAIVASSYVASVLQCVLQTRVGYCASPFRNISPCCSSRSSTASSTLAR